MRWRSWEAAVSSRRGSRARNGETNANAPKDKKPEDVTLDEALSLLDVGGGKKKKPPAKKAAG